MRRVRFLSVAGIALAVTGCARDAQYVEQITPPANVPIPSVASMFSPPPVNAQQAYERPPLPPQPQRASATSRDLFTSRSVTADTARSTAQSFSPRHWYPTSANNQQFSRRPPSLTSAPQPVPVTDRGPFASRWAGIYATQADPR